MRLLERHQPVEGLEFAPDAEALIREAKRRERRRRLGVALVVLLLAGAAGATVSLVGGKGTGGVSAPNTQPLGKGTPTVDAQALHGYGSLAFVSQGNLYVLDGATGKLAAVTTAREQATSPTFSPNGKWLLYSDSGSGEVWLAKADGSSPRRLGRTILPEWLPNGDLVAGHALVEVTSNGALKVVESLSQAPSAWSPDGDEYVFSTNTLRVNPPKSSHGVIRLEVSKSLTSPRILWYEAADSFTGAGGIEGNLVQVVDVLPHQEGILVRLDPYGSASIAADGLGLYFIRSPMAPLEKLAITVGDTVSVGPDSRIAVGAGGNRYAWLTKFVELCRMPTANCTTIRTSKGVIALDPSWAPNGEVLAFVEAKGGFQSEIGQSDVVSWYQTHHLWTLSAGSATPTEVPNTLGASTPVWSASSKSVLYVSGDALWLIPRLGERPMKVAAPLFPTNNWTSYYGEVNWSSQFAWSASS